MRRRRPWLPRSGSCTVCVPLIEHLHTIQLHIEFLLLQGHGALTQRRGRLRYCKWKCLRGMFAWIGCQHSIRTRANRNGWPFQAADLQTHAYTT